MSVLADVVGRVLPDGEWVTEPQWLVRGLVQRAGLSAIAVTDTATRLAVGISTCRLLLGDAVAAPLGWRIEVPEPLQSVAVLATSAAVARHYNRGLADTVGAKVVALRPWMPQDDTYFPALREWAADFDAVVIDTVNSIPNGNAPLHLGREVAEMHRTVVGLYQGAGGANVGVGGEQLWADAVGARVHLNAKNMLQYVDVAGSTPVQALPPSLPQLLAAVSAVAAPTAEQVHQLGELAKRVDRRGGPNAVASVLLTQALGLVRSICGREPTQSELARAIDQHSVAFARGVQGRPLAGAAQGVSDEPPF